MLNRNMDRTSPANQPVLLFYLSIIAISIFSIAILCSKSAFSAESIGLNINKFNSNNQKKTFQRHSTAHIFLQQGSAVVAEIKKSYALKENEDFKLLNKVLTPEGKIHLKYVQTVDGKSVFGKQISIHIDQSGLYWLGGEILIGATQDVQAATLLRSISRDEAVQRAKESFEEHYAKEKLWNFERELTETTITLKNKKAVEVVHVSFIATPYGHVSTPIRYNALVNKLGKILDHWNSMVHTQASGPGGNLKTGRYEFGTDYGYLSVTQNSNGCLLENSRVKTLNMNHSTHGGSVHSFTCSTNNEKEINGAYSPLNDAHYFGDVVFDLYKDWFQLSPLNQKLEMRVHYGHNYENAFWDGQRMTFGDGANRFYPLVGLDIVAHEVSHGFTEQNSGLNYSNQSGGINESFSDVAGEAAEFYLLGQNDWLVGEKIFKSPNSALRYFEDPTRDGRSIGHAANYYTGMDVHYSSGVFNRAFFLLTNSTGWDIQKAFTAYLNANRFYWTPTTNYIEGACGVILAARDNDYDWQVPFEVFKQVGLTCVDLPIDTDSDGMPDLWELEYGLNTQNADDAALDDDNDQLTNLQEFFNKTNPNVPDTDNDGLIDGLEVNTHHTNPILWDSDRDTLPDGWEITYQFDPLSDTDAATDADSDTFINKSEYALGTDPRDPNSTPPFISNYFTSFESSLNTDWSNPITSNASWILDAEYHTDGQKSLKANTITHNRSAAIQWHNYFEEGLLTFDYKVSSESGYDFFVVKVDSKQILRVSGEISGRKEITLSRGVHDLTFEYIKDGSVLSGSDTAWIDNLRFVLIDTDHDGINDAWEIRHGLDPNNDTDADIDGDNDGLSNLQEYEHQTDPNIFDTDEDGLSDGDEVNTSITSPTVWDSDGDLLPDGLEFNNGLDPLNSNDAALDLDLDGITNLDEFRLGSNINDPNSVPQPIISLYESFENGIPHTWFQPDSTDKFWQWSTSYSHVGSSSISSENITNGQSSAIKFVGYFNDLELSFHYKMESEASFDRFDVLLDDEVFTTKSGVRSESITLPLSSGIHTVTFRYTKDFSISSGADKVWIDNLRIEKPDLDSDGMANNWERQHQLDPNNASDASLDPDGDGLTNLEEFTKNTDPRNPDTDGDGLPDGSDLAPTVPHLIEGDIDTNRTVAGGSISLFILLGLYILAFARKPRWIKRGFGSSR